MTSLEALVVLNMLESVGPVTVRKLLEEFGSPERILDQSLAALERIPSVNRDAAHAIATWHEKIDLSAELRRCQEFGCQIISFLDDDYPRLLKEIYDPPLVLYVKGTITAADGSGVAIVGSRRTTNYGRETARKLAQQLGQAGVTVVSGGARGIDSSAHFGALHVGGRTICVVGNGINLIYPPENRELFDRIADQGAVATQFPFNRQADRQTFPIRNRIVAGMTVGTVVVEANAQSGALITANMANDAGRQVFAVPGPVHSPRSKGCHQLIKNGAKLCESVEDILSEIEYLFPQKPMSTELFEGDLEGGEAAILSMIRNEDIHIDELVRNTKLSVAVVSVTLLKLEMRGLIVQQPGHVYSAAGRC